MKRSQVSTFMIIGVFMISIILLVAFSYNSSKTDIYKKNMQDSTALTLKTGLNDYILQCLQLTAKEAIKKEGISSEETLEKYINDHLIDTIDKKTIEKMGFSVNLSQATTQISLAPENPSMVIDTKIPFTLKSDKNTITNMDEFHHSIDIIKKSPVELKSDGTIAKETHIDSGDEQVKVMLPENILAIDDNMQPISEISINMIPNDDKGIIGKVQYDILPHARFSQPIQLVFDYDKDMLQGTDPDQLDIVYLSNGIWRALPTEVDTQQKKIYAATDHFTTFAIHGSCKKSSSAPDYFDTGNLFDKKITTLEKNQEAETELIITMQGKADERLCLNTMQIFNYITYPINSFKINDLPDLIPEDELVEGFAPCIQPIDPGTIYQEEFIDAANALFSMEDTWQKGKNTIRIKTKATIPEQIIDKVYKGGFMTCSASCIDSPDPILCEQECNYELFDWVTRFKIMIFGNFVEGCNGPDEICIDITPIEYTPLAYPSDISSISTLDSEDDYPVLTPYENENGDLKWYYEDCTSIKCGDGNLDRESPYSQEYEECDYMIDGFEEGSKYTCKDGKYWEICTEDCKEYEIDEEIEMISVEGQKRMIEMQKLICHYDSEYCTETDPECDGKTNGEICTNGICTDCKCIPLACGDGIIHPDEFCDNNQDIPWGEKRLHYCKDNMHLSKCNDDCTDYIDQEMCWWDATYCNGGSIECSGKIEGESCGEHMICNDQCQCIKDGCGNKKIDTESPYFEVCDSTYDYEYCLENRYLAECNDDCTTLKFKYKDNLRICHYDETDCNDGSPECKGKIQGEKCSNDKICDTGCRCINPSGLDEAQIISGVLIDKNTIHIDFDPNEPTLNQISSIMESLSETGLSEAEIIYGMMISYNYNYYSDNNRVDAYMYQYAQGNPLEAPEKEVSEDGISRNNDLKNTIPANFIIHNLPNELNSKKEGGVPIDFVHTLINAAQAYVVSENDGEIEFKPAYSGIISRYGSQVEDLSESFRNYEWDDIGEGLASRYNPADYYGNELGSIWAKELLINGPNNHHNMGFKMTTSDPTSLYGNPLYYLLYRKAVIKQQEWAIKVLRGIAWIPNEIRNKYIIGEDWHEFKPMNDKEKE